MSEQDDAIEHRAPMPEAPKLVVVVCLLAILVALTVSGLSHVDRARPQAVVPLLSGAILLLGIAVVTWLATPMPRAEPPEREAWLCKYCFKPYVPGAHVCPRCAAPQTGFACTAEYERAHAVAWCLGRAARKPTHWIHVVGLLAVVLPSALSMSLWTVRLILPVPAVSHDLVAVFIWTFVSTAWLFILVALTVLGWRAWRRHRRGAPFPLRDVEYGSPPWWTHDVEWALPEFEAGPDEDPPP